MNMQVMMGIVVAMGVGAAVFLFSSASGEKKDTEVIETSLDASEELDVDLEDLEERVESPSNEEMFANIEASIEANPSDRKRVYKYGAALVGLGEFERAEKFYLKQLNLFPADVQIAYGLGWCHEQNKRWSQAVEAYTKATLIDNRHRVSKNNLAWILATAPDEKVRNGRRAVALATQAVGNEHPPSPRFMDTLAAAYAEAGSFQNAVKIQRYVSRKTKGDNKGVEKRLELYLQGKPYRVAE